MACFTIAKFVEGNVYADGWWTPYQGQRVYLFEDEGKNLCVTHRQSQDTVIYTWPRKDNPVAARLAWRHYEKKSAHKG